MKTAMALTAFLAHENVTPHLPPRPKLQISKVDVNLRERAEAAGFEVQEYVDQGEATVTLLRRGTKGRRGLEIIATGFNRDLALEKAIKLAKI